uniref:Uncharacterized protein n=1 Tax=Guillardia theta TaxID=55529 RepID=A0A6U5YV40_GUITH
MRPDRSTAPPSEGSKRRWSAWYLKKQRVGFGKRLWIFLSLVFVLLFPLSNEERAAVNAHVNSGSGLAFSQIRCLLKHERARGRPVFQLPLVKTDRIEKSRRAIHSPSMVAGYARNADDGSGMSFGSRRWFLFPLKYEAQADVAKVKPPVKQKIKSASRNNTQPEMQKKATSGKKATKFLLEGVISLGLAAQSMLGNSSQAVETSEVSDVSTSDLLEDVAARNVTKEEGIRGDAAPSNAQVPTNSVTTPESKDAPWQYTWTPEKGDYWAYELGYRLSSSAVSTIASALDYARGKISVSDSNEIKNAAGSNQTAGAPLLLSTELLEKDKDENTTAVLNRVLDAVRSTNAAGPSLAREGAASVNDSLVEANSILEAAPQNERRSKREEFFHFMQNLAFWQMEFWKAEEPGNLSLSERNRTDLLSDQEERVLEAWKEAEAFIKEEKVMNSSSELAGSVLFQGLLADSINGDGLKESNASAIDGLTGVAKDEVQDLFVGLFEGMSPVSSSLPSKLDAADLLQTDSSEPEASPATGGTQSFALASSSSGSLADAVVRLFKSVGLDSAAYEQKLEEAKVTLLQSIGVGSKGPLDEYSPDWQQAPKFDMSLAAVMAHYAFESYNYPVDGRWEEHLDGTRTCYLSPDIVRSLYDGIICMKIAKLRQSAHADDKSGEELDLTRRLVKLTTDKAQVEHREASGCQ